MTPRVIGFMLMSAALVGSSALLLYPTVAYARNVMYTRGVQSLAAALLLLTVGWLVNDLLYYDVVSYRPLLVVSEALFALSSVTVAYSCYRFARDFVSFGDEEFEVPGGEVGEAGAQSSGGFENADD